MLVRLATAVAYGRSLYKDPHLIDATIKYNTKDD
jgi:hypothetical protein